MNAVKLYYCKQCSDKLHGYGKLVLEIFEFVCEEYCFDKTSTFIDESHEYFPIFDYLEKKGYLISTECGIELIQFKPKELKIFHNENSVEFKFCMNSDMHQ